MEQLTMSSSVPLGSSDDVIGARIVDVLAALRAELLRYGTTAPYSAPPLPTNEAQQLYGDDLKLARYSEDGLRIIVQIARDVEHKPWHVVVVADAFGTGAALQAHEKTAP